MPHQPPLQSSGQQTRFDVYLGIHKGLRAFMSEILVRVGHTDYTDAREREETAEQLRALLHVCGEHLKHEDNFLHPAMERRSPGSTARCAHEHVQHFTHIAVLHASLEEALHAPAEAQATAWRELYQALSRFVAESLEHMLIEEREHNAVLWAHYTDAEIIEIHDALVASIPAQEMALVFRWIVPQLAHPERVAMLGDMRKGMPDEVFASQLDMARPLLDARSWHKLQAAFKLPTAARQTHNALAREDKEVCHG